MHIMANDAFMCMSDALFKWNTTCTPLRLFALGNRITSNKINGHNVVMFGKK